MVRSGLSSSNNVLRCLSLNEVLSFFHWYLCSLQQVCEDFTCLSFMFCLTVSKSMGNQLCAFGCFIKDLLKFLFAVSFLFPATGDPHTYFSGKKQIDVTLIFGKIIICFFLNLYLQHILQPTLLWLPSLLICFIYNMVRFSHPLFLQSIMFFNFYVFSHTS